ncbi:MAG: C4-dicarboxylate ABC transporter [Prevotella sp.]|nr:C4-dicarboxylate ABC transporter [Prevotella sp.]
MSRGRDIRTILQPLNKQATQTYLGTGLHTLGLLNWILQQTGRADVYVSTFSTSEAFLNGFYNLRKKHLIGHSVLLADLKASKKTLHLYRLMQSCFDSVYLGMNHSKIVLVQNDSHFVSVISSQNQTYGDRAECTMVTTDQMAFYNLYSGLRDIVDKNSIQLNGLFNRIAERDNQMRESTNDPIAGVLPFGY